jgi:predicted lipoprotein with Yx(FWY)xxD motif
MRKPLLYVSAAVAVAGLAAAAFVAYNTSESYSAEKVTRIENVKNETAPQQQPQQTAAPSPPPVQNQGNGSTLNAVDNPELGPIVVDAQGFTLYRFDKDTANPSASNCNGECAAAWPPVLTSGKWKDVSLSGVAKENVGFIERADGTCQLTIGGWPVYRYAKDTKPGDVLGQGVGGTWFAVTPDGKKAGNAQSNLDGNVSPNSNVEQPESDVSDDDY